jgi:FKBP-type peptidyl-prolyl cis-trans isomerase FklB
MKYATLALMGIGLAVGSSIAIGQAPTPKGESEMKTTMQKYAYLIGLDLGRKMKANDINFDPEIIAKGIKDGLADKPAFTDQQAMEIAKAFQQEMDAKQAAAQPAPTGDAAKTLKAGRDFLAANKVKQGVNSLPNGMQYKILKPGTGKAPKLGDMVSVNYRGTLIDGTEFDSSYKRNKPFDFELGGQVIAGWNEIVQKMKVGDRWQVFIPNELGYGARGAGRDIKPYEALIFEIELLGVK